jgi:hypothetical protein
MVGSHLGILVGASGEEGIARLVVDKVVRAMRESLEADERQGGNNNEQGQQQPYSQRQAGTNRGVTQRHAHIHRRNVSTEVCNRSAMLPSSAVIVAT